MGDASAETKIYHFYSLLGLIKQDILQLDVSVRYIPLVTVIDALYDLTPEEFGLELGHLPVGFHFEVPVQAAPIHELHDQENLLVRLERFI